MTSANAVALAGYLTGANESDAINLEPLVDAIPAVRGRRGRPRRRPGEMLADRGYDSRRNRDGMRRRGIRPRIARRNTEHGSGLGKHRWVIEQNFAHLHGFRRLQTRWEQRGDIAEGLFDLGMILINARRL